MINADFAEDQERIKKLIKAKAENAKNTDKDASYKRVTIYTGGGGQATNVQDYTAALTNSKTSKTQEAGIVATLLSGALVPKGFEHYSFCSCYKPSPDYPTPTMELAELEMLSEKDARRELSRMCTLLRKQRILYMTKDMCQKSKYQDQINHLKKQLTNNSYLWDQLAESEKRERVLKQELLYTQQSLSAAEKTIISLKDDIKLVDAERSRLLNFKTSRVEKFKELEIKVHKYDLMDNIDTDQLIAALARQEKKLQATEGLSKIWQNRINEAESSKAVAKKKLEKKFVNEQAKTQQVIEKMEQMKLELKMLETNDSSVASIWKKKCLDLFEVCQAMKNENDELRDRCKELIQQGLDLASTIGEQGQDIGGESLPREFRSYNQTQQLPDLSYTNQSILKGNTNYLGGPSSPSGHVDTRGGLYSTINTQQRSQRSSQGMRSGISVMTPQPVTPVHQNEQLFLKTRGVNDTSQGIDQHLAQLGFKTLKPPVLRGRTTDIEIPPSHLSTKHTQNQQQRQTNDIKSILSGDSNPQNFSRATQPPHQASQHSKSNLTSTQVQTGQAMRRRQNYINQQLQPQTQDSIFNQSQATNLPYNRNIVTADHNTIAGMNKGESIRMQMGQRSKPLPHQLLSFDLQGKSLNQQALPVSPKPITAETRQGSGYNRKSNSSTQKSLNLNVQRLQMATDIGQTPMMSPIAVHQQTTDFYVSSQRQQTGGMDTVTKNSKQSITSALYERQMQPLISSNTEGQSSQENSIEK